MLACCCQTKILTDSQKYLKIQACFHKCIDHHKGKEQNLAAWKGKSALFIIRHFRKRGSVPKKQGIAMIFQWFLNIWQALEGKRGWLSALSADRVGKNPEPGISIYVVWSSSSPVMIASNSEVIFYLNNLKAGLTKYDYQVLITLCF